MAPGVIATLAARHLSTSRRLPIVGLSVILNGGFGVQYAIRRIQARFAVSCVTARTVSKRIPGCCSAYRRALARNWLEPTFRMFPNPVVLMLYLELVVFLAGLACMIVARTVEARGARAQTTSENAGRNKPAFVLSRLGA